MELLHTVEQAATILQLHPDTIRVWLRSGRLRGRKLGRVWRIPETELRHLSGVSGPSLSPSHDGTHPDIEEPNT